MKTQMIRRQLAVVAKTLAVSHKGKLENLQSEHKQLSRSDFVWHYLLQSFATMGRASGWYGLIGNPENYGRLRYEVLAALAPEARQANVRQVCRAAGIRMPDKKADYILACFEYVRQLGGP